MGTIYKTGDKFQFMFQDFFAAYDAKEITFEAAPQSGKSEYLKDYLEKGERIESLARDIYQRKIGRITMTDAEKKIFAITMDDKMSYFDVVHRISKAFTRPCLRSMEKPDDEYAKALLGAVAFPGLNIEMDIMENTGLIRGYLRNAIPKRNNISLETDKIIHVRFVETDYPVMFLYGFKNTTHTNKSYALRNTTSAHILIVDMADFFSSLIIYSQVMRKVNEYLAANATEREQSLTLDGMKRKLDAFIACAFRSHLIRICPEKMTLVSIKDIYRYPLFVKSSDYAKETSLLTQLTKDGVIVTDQIMPCRIWSKELAGKGPSVGVRNMNEFAACFLLTYCNVFPYHRLLYGDSSIGKFFWGLPVGYRTYSSSKICDSEIMELFKELFFVIAEEKAEQIKSLDYYEDLSRDHAKSYQLKKAIPKRVMTAMEQSLFNRYFGFVEFDDETDISKAEEIAKEFMALKETYLKDIDSSENAIRFRKLGNHKAMGLYYPSVKCLCVDIKSPESLVHEYGHLIDYTKGGLSELKSFSDIRKRYNHYLHAQMEKNEETKSLMTGKTKYNLNYYSRPTEIFARCFELYISRILGVRNSIVPISFNETVYPQDNDFLKVVADYFNSLLGINPGESNSEHTQFNSCDRNEENGLVKTDEKVASQKTYAACRHVQHSIQRNSEKEEFVCQRNSQRI